jgi:cell surface protein SprA
MSYADPRPFNIPFETKVPSDTSKKAKRDNSKPNYNPKDRYGDPISNPESNSPLLLKSPSTTEIEMDSVKGTFTIYEKTGDMDYRTPTTMTFDEYMKYRDRQMMKSYFNSKTGSGDSLGLNGKAKDLNPANLRLPAPGIGSIFGKDYVEIKPNGSVTLDFAGKWQRTQNPNVPVRQQRNGGFEFDQQISLNIIGSIGDKLKLTANWDTKASFDFQNNLKLQYTGYEEDIIQAIEAGNVSFPVNSSLIQGSQNLFGIKTKLQFGRLSVTSVMSSQRGKQEEITIDGGSQARDFEIRADQYDENKNFFLSHYFRSKYEPALKSLPTVTSGIKISRVDVYVTNTNANTKDTRSVVAYLDLGESDSILFNKIHTLPGGQPGLKPADNNANSLYGTVSDTAKVNMAYHDLELLPGKLEELNMKNGSDYVIINNARKLSDKEYRFNPELGYISLNTTVRQNEAIAVAFQYVDPSGKDHQVGEIPGAGGKDSTDILVLKLIKPNNVNTRLPTWDLMMKNVYQLGTSQMTGENFKFNIIYKNDESGADLPFLQEGERTNKKLLIRLTGLDRLGPNLDPPSDGNLDFIEGVTVDSRNGRIIFPVLEPFGSNMAQYFNKNETNLKDKYVFTELYDSTRSGMLNYSRKNKYFLKGKYQGGSADNITLPGLSIAQGSVIVTAGSTPLKEGTDYTVNYQTGNINIINKGVLESGQQIKIRFEKTDLFNFRRKSFLGTRMDYRINKDINIGGTVLHQSEAPQISRVSIGDEPSKNTLAGLDFTFSKESRMITKMVDLLPVIQTKAPSNVSFQGETAGLFPGHSKAINKGGNTGGVSYLDDFESAETPTSFTNSVQKWFLGSTPSRFIESGTTTRDYTRNRARLSWFVVDNLFYRGTGAGVKPKNITDEDMKNHFIREIVPQEIFPKRDVQQMQQPEPVLNFAFYPSERGPYNYNTNLDSEGKLKNPSDSWGAVTRAFGTTDIDFDNANIQYIEFWMMSPYIKESQRTLIDGKPFDLNNKGKLYFNLGSVSEDIMKDQKHAYENGLPVKAADIEDPKKVSLNQWGRVTKQAFLTNSFDNTAGSRDKQDLGLDGFNSEDEKNYFDSTYLNRILGLSPSALAEIQADPSGDDFRYFLDDNYDNAQASLLARYKKFNGMENNSPLNETEGAATKSYTTVPDNEDISGDNNVDNLEEYFEYEIDIDPARLVVGQNYVVDKRVVTDKDKTSGDEVTWYQFRIPIREPDHVEGNISGFKSIKFMRMYMTEFESPVVLRMAQMQLVANQWRVYQNTILEPTESFPNTETRKPEIVVSSVNIEENGVASENKVNYTTPPGFYRDQDITSLNNRQMNEQSLQVCVDQLGEGQGRSVFKYVNVNLLNYKRFKMFLSANTQGQAIDGAATAFVRIGTDFEENYYEIEVPLHYTIPSGSVMQDIDVWRSENFIDVSLEDLVAVKTERNQKSASTGSLPNYKLPYATERSGRMIVVKGNPDLSAVQTLMIGVKNPVGGKTTDKVQTCIWANEMLVSDFVESAGYAAMATGNIQLADLATVTSSIKYTGAGFGSLDQKVSQRERNNTLQYGVASNITLDKFIPGKHGIKLPLYLSHDKKAIMPKYNPLDPDVKLKESLESQPEETRESYKDKVIDETVTNSWNLTNVRKIKTKSDTKNHFWDVENLSLTYGVTHRKRHNHLMKEYDFKNHKGGVGYNYNSNPKSYEPFKNLKAKSPYFKLVKDFNYTLRPASITVRSDYDKRLTKTVYYAGDPRYDILQDPIWEKSFTTNRTYGLNWNFTKALTGDFNASTFAVFDEPETIEPGTEAYKKAVWKEFKGFGRKKSYNQTAGLNYKLPLDKLPFTDWLGVDTRYAAGYNWVAGAKDLQDTLGNTISNKQDMNVTGRINLEKIYNKSKFLKDINNPAPTRKMGPPVKTDAKKDTAKKEEEKQRDYKVLKQALRGVMSLKMINMTYTQGKTTSLGGYLPGVDYLGMEHNQRTNMLPFIFGSQDAGIRKTISDKGEYSKSSLLNTPFNQTKSENLTLRTSIEPVRDFRVQLDLLKNKTSGYSEMYRFRKDSASGIEDYYSDAPLRTGSYSISFIAIGSTFLGKSDPSDPNSSRAFDRFEAYRHKIQERMESSGKRGDEYGTNSHEIMIPAFVAAYSGKDPDKVKLTSFPSIPVPNWRIDFTGLTRLKQVSKVFSLFSITHSYNSTFTISNFTSSLKYSKTGIINPDEDFDDPISSIDNLVPDKEGKILSPYVIDQVVISERFAPLIGVNFRTKNKIEGRLEYTQDRSMTLTMSNAQIQEVANKGVVIGIGYAKAGIKLPFASGGNPYTILKNEVKFRVDASIRDGRTVQRKIEDASTTTQGNLNWQLKPTINYLVNNRLNVNIYFERTQNIPRVSSSFKRSTTAFGVQLRFTLS